jgi:hypothetical protein
MVISRPHWWRFEVQCILIDVARSHSWFALANWNASVKAVSDALSRAPTQG